jgi:uncharacterized repeat protein (TIGR01451 family)
MTFIQRSVVRFLALLVAGVLPDSLLAQNYVTPIVAQTPGVSSTGLTTGQFTIVNNASGALYSDPHVSGDLVCYTVLAKNSFTVHYFNLTASLDTQIPNPDTAQYFDFLCGVRGAVITFTRTTATDSSIMTFDTSVPGAQPVQVSPSSVFARVSSIGDATVIWEQLTPGELGWDIYAYDRTDGTNQQIDPASIAGLYNQAPRVSPDGTVAVWTSAPNAGSVAATWKAVLANGVWTPQQLVSEVQGNQTHPDTDGVTITYDSQYLLNGLLSNEIVWQPVNSGTEQVLNASATALNFNPSISAGFISFDMEPPGSDGYTDLAVYDIVGNVLYNVTSDLATAGLISEGHFVDLNDISVTSDGKLRVVWQDFTADAIYAYTFSVSAADLSVQKLAYPTEVQSKGDLGYLLVVHNLGPETSNNVFVTDPLPAGTTFLVDVPSRGSCAAPAVGSTGTVSCNLGSLANGAYAWVGILVNVNAAGGTTLTNTATVSSTTLDANPSNNSSTVTTPVYVLYYYPLN